MIYVHWIVLTIYTIIAIVTMLTVLLEHRQPAKTIAWILVLTFMPIIGIIIYFFLSLIHISEPTRLLSISYAVFCLKKKKNYARN